MSKKVSRREFARASAAVGAAAVVIPKTLLGKTPAEASTGANSSPGT